MKKYCPSDCTHDLVHHWSMVLDALWRMDQFIEDARKEGCEDVEKFWQATAEQLKSQSEWIADKLGAKAGAGELKPK